MGSALDVLFADGIASSEKLRETVAQAVSDAMASLPRAIAAELRKNE
ncbi:MAG: hypothetical protein JO233_01500 [Candidatus Eremiobacteraeota bacterium]|nr:hypothetical protein [Candidatus Eremiobacteraeota bacterium]